MHLSSSQKAAIKHIEQYALLRKETAAHTIEDISVMSNISGADLQKAVATIKAFARVALHFHPDRLDPEGKSVAEALFESGIYKNQFETQLSNGMLSPYRGGPRDNWENSLFGGAFSLPEISVSERPKYGALDLMRHPDGPSPRFGSCYFLLKPSVSARCTFSYMDSHRQPAEKGTLNAFEDILAALLTECFERQYALGERDLMPAALIERLLTVLPEPYRDTTTSTPARNLNHYIEAQVHGTVLLQEDVEILVADPSFQQEATGELLARLCHKYSIKLQWHTGFSMQAAAVPLDFRGPTMPSLAERVADNGIINAAQIGKAAANLKQYPELWADRGPYEKCLQELKMLWHVLVHYGLPQQASF